MRISDMKTADEVLAEDLKDPKFREEWERTALARAVANHVIAYRAEHSLTQRQLANRLGMKQPAVARLESGEHEPTLATLARLSRGLGLEFHIDITPEAMQLMAQVS
ncbi:MAG: helix-turn-helix transcriptional regulator [Rubrobacter sp.]|jgi:DNA-binding XRE family transcriptional regulator